MLKSTRVLIGLVVIEALLAGGTLYMVLQTRSGAWETHDKAEAIRVITQTMGGAMGIIVGVLLVVFAVLRLKGN